MFVVKIVAVLLAVPLVSVGGYELGKALGRLRLRHERPRIRGPYDLRSCFAWLELPNGETVSVDLVLRLMDDALGVSILLAGTNEHPELEPGQKVWLQFGRSAIEIELDAEGGVSL